VTTAATLEIRAFRPADEAAVIALWRRCELVVPWNDPHEDIRRKRAAQPDLLLVGMLDGTLVATVMAGYEGHRGWINYLAVAPTWRRHGFGRQMMAAAEAALRALGCPKVNLMVRGTNAAVVAFYERLGFAVEDRVSMGKPLT
jgi:ribosomal protein S18 acetylase RimI-like enzyme